MKMMLTVTLLVCAMMALTSAAGDNPTNCPSGWKPSDGRCFNYVPTTMSWAHAEKHCLNLGGNLASVHSFQEYNVIQSMILDETQEYPNTWLGGNDATQEGVWLWSDGTPFDFNYWSVGQPDDSGYCLVMNYGDLKKFDDQPCRGRKPFVCAIKL
ncbi:type-2 ice-structuring protein-like [Chaetodon trifascialis]|uniref:type-2 ice-structuring protein-like n=1 Tax=Chaetodon trifascialis TaxID=109706 RepID=UPI0039922AC7